MDNQQNNIQQPVYNQTSPQPSTLAFGILSLVFGPILAIIFGAIGKSRGKKYIAEGGTLTGASKVGYILSRIGFILGIVSLVCIVVVAVLVAAGVVPYEELSKSFTVTL